MGRHLEEGGRNEASGTLKDWTSLEGRGLLYLPEIREKAQRGGTEDAPLPSRQRKSE